MMDKNTEFLDYIYQNSSMGVTTISRLINIVNNDQFKPVLQNQLNEYTDICNQSKAMIETSGKDAKNVSSVSKISSYIMMNLNTMMDSSSSHIADMLIQGSTMGVVDITKRLNSYGDASGQPIELAKRLLTTEQKNIEDLKRFL